MEISSITTESYYDKKPKLNFYRSTNSFKGLTPKIKFLYFESKKTYLFYYLNPRYEYLLDYLELSNTIQYEDELITRIENSFPIIFPKYISYYYDCRMSEYLELIIEDCYEMYEIFFFYEKVINSFLFDGRNFSSQISAFQNILRDFQKNFLKRIYKNNILKKECYEKIFPTRLNK